MFQWLERSSKDRVGAERTVNVKALRPRLLDRRHEKAIVLVAQEAALARVGAESGHSDATARVLSQTLEGSQGAL